MKRAFSVIVGLMAWAFLSTAAWATADSVNVVSDDSTSVYYNDLLDPSPYPVEPAPADILPEDWNTPGFDDSGWSLAVFYQNNAYLDPAGTVPLAGTGAAWISFATAGWPDATATGLRGVYLYRKTFLVPATAYNLSGAAAIAADNYGWLYLNGFRLLGPKDTSGDGVNFTDPPSSGVIPEEALSGLTCESVVAAEVQNGTSSGTNGATATVFLVNLNYELPDVSWRPPVSNQNFVLKIGRTLPLKFRLYKQDGKLIRRKQNVYLTVYGPDDEIARWDLGNGVTHLRFSPGNGQYIANFKTKKFDLVDGGHYTAFVHDGCTDEALGSISFDAVGSKGKGKK
jgi:hypothetical protein